jgi:PKD repeat protein
MLFLILLCLPLTLAGCKGGGSTTGSAVEPAITSMSPSQVLPGQGSIEGHIFGTNLGGVMSVNLGDGITVENISGVSASDVYVFFSVSRSASMGARTISVTTSGGLAASSSAFTIGNNVLPVAKFTLSPPSGYRETVFRFDASGSYDPNGSITDYRWTFDDGSTAHGKIVTHKYQRNGSLRTALNVTDNQNATDQTSRYVDVAASRPPIAVFSISPPSGDTNTDFQFNGTASHDPDGRITLYTWVFSDGSSSSGSVVTHRYSTSANYSVVLTVQDNTGVLNTTARDVRVDQAPPDDGGGGGGGGGGELCTGSNFDGQSFQVEAVSGRVITADVEFQTCPGLCAEIRRNADGIMEFAGDASDFNGNNCTYDPGNLPPSTNPQAGETLRMIWRNCN